MNPRFILLGGFLGAGKTTTLARLARHYTDQGLKVAIVTNDQTTDLVDTHSLRSQGFDVGEVAGACFCCSFNDLTKTVDGLSRSSLPDVILAEPVGSCTDLVATVVRPLSSIYERPLEIAPYGVILKPSHGLRILRNEPRSGFSPKAAYIFRKQLEEADFLIVNRIDELTDATILELETLLERDFPERPTLRLSAKTGAGFESLVQQLSLDGQFGQRLIDVDYDVYAEGEAELGWLNSQLRIASKSEFDLDTLLLAIATRLSVSLASNDAETAHLKVIGMWEGNYAVANHVSSFTQPELSLPSGARVSTADIVVNARVATDPKLLEQIVRDELQKLCSERGAELTLSTMQSFRPGRPVPTHRIPASI
ncbi:MAG: GTP-binding protein [Pirellulaceae bacterium]|nr:GTP-binding protein [Pirellulaceae bacterium]